MALHLAERGSSVLLLEAGPGQAHPATRTANMFSALSMPELQWADTWVEHHPGSTRVPYVRGRVLGGGSAINGMVALAGDAQDWNWAPKGDQHDLSVHIRSALGEVLSGTTVVAASPLGLALADGLAQVGIGPGGPGAVDGSGFGPVPLNQHHGLRRADWAALPSKTRSGGVITVRGESSVRRVLLNARQVVGVELHDGTTVQTSRVVCCAGAVGSPALLWRSGIAVPGIGQGLQDHAGVRLLLRPEHRQGAADAAPFIRCGARWSSGIDGRTDLALLLMEQVDPATPELSALTIGLMTPRSRGQLVQEGREGQETLVLQPNLLTDPTDLARLRIGVRTVLNALDRAGIEVIGAPQPDTDALDEWMTSTTDGWYHATGTCRMGPSTDPLTVVDGHFGVMGFDGLQVIDASVLPRVTSATTEVAVRALTTLASRRLSA